MGRSESRKKHKETKASLFYFANEVDYKKNFKALWSKFNKQTLLQGVKAMLDDYDKNQQQGNLNNYMITHWSEQMVLCLLNVLNIFLSDTYKIENQKSNTLNLYHLYPFIPDKILKDKLVEVLQQLTNLSETDLEKLIIKYIKIHYPDRFANYQP
jgi:hypothetical protein